MNRIRRVLSLSLLATFCHAFQIPHRKIVWQTPVTSLNSERRRGNKRQSSVAEPSDPFGDYDDDDYDFDSPFSQANDDWQAGFDSIEWDENPVSGGRANDDAPDAAAAAAAAATAETSAKKKGSHFFSKLALKDPRFRNSKLFDLLCEGVGIERPSRIQSLAWPVLLEGKHAIIADQTGSGKTLAYLMPLLQRALQSLARDKDRRNGAPRILVLAPTAELADQIRAVCDKLNAKVPFRTVVITATGMYSTSIRDQIRLLQRQPVDVMISTPGRLATILRTKNSGLDLSSLQSIVLDEVDVLMVDETFGPQLRTVGVAAPVERTQFVFVTATLPDNVVETVEKEFPGVTKVRGPGLHRVAPSVKEHLVDVSVPSQYNRDPKQCFDVKAKELLKSLRQNRCRRTLIFCNTVDNCRRVENLLSRRDRKGQIFEVGAYHNAMTPESRNANLKVFAKGRKKSNVDYVLVCTDRAARGVDFEASPVDHVVLFDFPRDPAEYVRRVGRTGRAGRTGTTTVFAYGWQLPIARKVMGSKLESFTSAAFDDEDEDDFRSRKAMDRDQNDMVKGNIERGRLWKNR